jgi:hypothetical protein
MVNFLGLLLVIYELYLYKWYRYRTSGIRSISLGKEGKKFWLVFVELFYQKRGGHTSRIYLRISAQNFHKLIGYLDSSQKNTQFKKKKLAEMEYKK